jgi:protein TonB
MFDYILPAKDKKTAVKKWMTFPVSLGFHALAIGSLVLTSLWAVRAVPDPPLPLMVKLPAPPPPAAPKGAVAKKPEQTQEKTKPKPIDPDAMVAPTVVPPEPPAVQNLPVEEPESEGGDQNGVIGGIGDGTESVKPDWAPEPGPTPAPDDAGPVILTHEVEKPVVLKKVMPAYPMSAKVIGLQGTVILEAVISREGTVESVRVMRSIPLLDDAAIEAAKQWRFTPAKIRGVPVRCYFMLKIRFELNPARNQS